MINVRHQSTGTTGHSRKDGEATREKILEAAEKVFGEKGFLKATHAEICRLAGVNTALINFHFGSKDALYRAVWQRVSDEVERRFPLDGGLPAQAPAAERLRAFIHALMQRALDPRMEGFHRLRTMECIAPTGMLDEALTQRLQQHRTKLLGIVRELLGPTADERTLELCEMSIISQCHLILPHHGSARRRPPHHYTHKDVDTLTEHITCFSLAGIEAIRRQHGIEDARP